MTIPYDRKILLVNWMGCITPGNTIADVAALIRDKMSNVAGMMLRTSNGLNWEGHLGDSGPKAVTGVARIWQWVEELDKQGLEVHVWGKPRALRLTKADGRPDLEKEAANVPGVQSLLLDVEHGPLYWQGTPQEAEELMTRIREGISGDAHIGMILDGRRNRPFSVWVDPWIPFVDSLHPMVYPILFSSPKTIAQHLDEAFANLRGYDRPIAPMLQAFAGSERRPTPDEIVQQGNAALARGAAGISFFRLGSDIWPGDQLPHTGEPEYAAIARIQVPDEAVVPAHTWQDVINAKAHETKGRECVMNLVERIEQRVTTTEDAQTVKRLIEVGVRAHRYLERLESPSRESEALQLELGIALVYATATEENTP